MLYTREEYFTWKFVRTQFLISNCVSTFLERKDNNCNERIKVNKMKIKQ